jgi:hypothetical protein
MSYRATDYRLLLVTLCATAGCTLLAPNTKPGVSAADDQTARSSSTAADSTATNPSRQATSATPGSSAASTAPAVISPPIEVKSTAGGSTPDPKVLADVLAEVAALGSVQPEAQQRLIEDLRKTDPAYWPMLVQTFRASLAYRRRAAERESKTSPPAVMSETEAQATTQEVESREAGGDARVTPEIKQASHAAPADSLPQAAVTSPPSNEPAKSADAPLTTNSPPAKSAESNTTWRDHLTAAIGVLERETHDNPQGADTLANQVYLRLLDLAAGRTDAALQPIQGVSQGEQDYWSKQLYALSTYLDRQRISDPARRAGEAGLHLTKATAALAEQGPLRVCNLAFCTRVDSYGVLKRDEPAEFKAGQKVLLYAEFESFKSEQSAEGYHTALEATYQILDNRGQRVARDDLPLTEEHCQNRRRDFFASYFVVLPKAIYEGTYTLELTIEDKLAHKIGQASIEFSIKDKK